MCLPAAAAAAHAPAQEKRDRERAARAGGGAPPVELADGVAAVAAEPRRQKKKAAQEQAAPQHPPCGPAPSEEERLRALKRQKLKDKRNLQRGGGSADAVGAEQAAPPLAPAAPPAKKAKATLLQKAQAQLSGACASRAAACCAPGTVLTSPPPAPSGGHFRWLNQELYTRPGVEALQLMSSQPDLFAQYHSGFRSQTAAWPVQPLDVCIAWLRRCPAWWTVADVGCGDARLALSAAQRVHSFDLVAVTPAVQACDMCALPLPDAALQAAVFCLSLMGTDYGRALQEAHRCLEARGTLWIAEVRSRFEGAAGGVDAFLGALQTLGFSLKARDESNTMFAVFRLVKGDQPQGKPQWPKLKACEYKKR